jgi:hypothetical protein
MGILLIVLGMVWFMTSLVFVCALAAAGRRPCPNPESHSAAFVLQVAPAVCDVRIPPYLFGTDAVPAT